MLAISHSLHDSNSFKGEPGIRKIYQVFELLNLHISSTPSRTKVRKWIIESGLLNTKKSHCKVTTRCKVKTTEETKNTMGNLNIVCQCNLPSRIFVLHQGKSRPDETKMNTTSSLSQIKSTGLLSQPFLIHRVTSIHRVRMSQSDEIHRSQNFKNK